MKTPWHEMPSRHLRAPLTSLSPLHAGKNLLYQFAAINHQENWESPSKCLPPSIPVPCPECKHSPQPELGFHNCIHQAIYIPGPLHINKISNFQLSAATVPTNIDQRALGASFQQQNQGNAIKCSHLCPARSAPRFFLR